MQELEPEGGHTRQEVTFSVIDQSGCPLFHAGDKMVLRLPEIDTTSGNVCAYAAAQVLPMVAAAARTGRSITEIVPRFRCISGGEHFASFELSSKLLVETVETKAARWLRQVPYFSGLSRPAMGRVVARLHSDQYFPRSHLVEQDTPVDRLVLITKGIAERVTVEPSSGFERIGGRLTEGEVFGAVELAARGRACASLRCLTIVQASVLMRQDLDELAATDPEIGEALRDHGC